MKRTLFVKVCGMKYAENIQEVSNLRPAFMGFIFYPLSTRCVDDRALVAKFRYSGKKVGIFVNESIGNILQIVDECALDGVQLHGNEPLNMCNELRKHASVVIKAISVSTANDIQRAQLYDNCVDYILFDTKTPTHGGSGKPFNWTLLPLYQGNTPFILSGGISLHHIQEIQQINHPKLVGIDINSGFELSPAQKDIGKLQAFFQHFEF